MSISGSYNLGTGGILYYGVKSAVTLLPSAKDISRIMHLKLMIDLLRL